MAALIPSASATGSGTMTLAGPSTNSNQTITIPDATGTMMVNGPTFSAYQSSSQTLSSSTLTKIQYQTKEWDTTTAFTSNTTYTPLIAGYYQVSSGIAMLSSNTGVAVFLYKNGSSYKCLYNGLPSVTSGGYGSVMVYLNGSTDYIEIYASFTVGQGAVNSQKDTYFQAVMVRSA